MLVGSSHTLPDGLRVRLRLPHGTDRPMLHDLAARAGMPHDELEVRRLVHVPPRSRTAIVAVAWVSGGELLVGYAAADIAIGEPDVLLADEPLAPGITALLTDAIAERCRSERVA